MNSNPSPQPPSARTPFRVVAWRGALVATVAFCSICYLALTIDMTLRRDGQASFDIGTYAEPWRSIVWVLIVGGATIRGWRKAAAPRFGFSLALSLTAPLLATSALTVAVTAAFPGQVTLDVAEFRLQTIEFTECLSSFERARFGYSVNGTKMFVVWLPLPVELDRWERDLRAITCPPDSTP